MMGVLMALGWLLLTLLKLAGVLLLILLVLLALVLLCPLCADVCWEGGVLTVRAGALGLTLPVFRWPAPEKPAGAEEPKGFWGKLKAKLRARREERKLLPPIVVLQHAKLVEYLLTRIPGNHLNRVGVGIQLIRFQDHHLGLLGFQALLHRANRLADQLLTVPAMRR